MKKIFLCLLLFCVIFISYQRIRTGKYIKIGKQLSEAAIPNAYEQRPENQEMRILNIGDSSVVGVGAKNPKNSVAGRLGKTYPFAEVVNDGVNGGKTKELIPRFEALQDQHFDIIVIHTGGNDIVRFTNVQEAQQDLETVIGLAKNISKKIIILHSGDVGSAKLFPIGTRWIFTKRTEQFMQAWKAVAENHEEVEYAQIFQTEGDGLFFSDPETYYAPDLFHPSDEGYGIWFRAIEKQL